MSTKSYSTRAIAVNVRGVLIQVQEWAIEVFGSEAAARMGAEFVADLLAAGLRPTRREVAEWIEDQAGLLKDERDLRDLAWGQGCKN